MLATRKEVFFFSSSFSAVGAYVCVCECVYVCAFVRSCDDDGGAGSVNPCEPPVSELLPKLAPSVVFTGASSKRGVGAGTKTKDFLNF